MAKVTSKGQVWLPVEVKEFLKVDTGDYIYFRNDEIHRVVWIYSKKDDFVQHEQPLLSKNQLTIPIKVRELHDIRPGDNILFDYDDAKENVYFKKELEALKCPVCDGAGKIEDLVCIVCREKGIVEKEFVMHELTRYMHQSRKYGVGINLISSEFDKEKGMLIHLMYHKVRLYSSEYPQHIIDKFQDYYQARIIEDFTPRSISDNEKFNNPTDVLLDEILSFLKTEEAKERVYKWFRYERNVFGSA